MLTGENGILTQAQKAKEATENAQAEEEKILQEYENYLNNITGDVSQVSDSNPGVLEGNGTEQEPFVINSIEDLVVFADNVTKGTNTYQDQYVELGLSLDFNSDKSYVNPDSEDYAQYGYNGRLKEVLNTTGFIPIGKMEYTVVDGVVEKENLFYGNFNGKGYKIYNLIISQGKNVNENTYIDSGMFSENYGTIQNVCLENGTNSTNMNGGKYLKAGLLVGENNGEISNCYVTGNVITSKMDWACNVGGLVGANGGTIKECYNAANVDAKYSYMHNRIGGVVGVNEEGANLENVYNVGNVCAKEIAEKLESTNTLYVGGIAGRNYSTLKNAYSIGKITNINNGMSYVRIGGGIGIVDEATEPINCYYLENVVNASKTQTTETTDGGEMKSSVQMKSQEFLDILNRDNSGMWKFSSGKNNGYPVLYWQ